MSLTTLIRDKENVSSIRTSIRNRVRELMDREQIYDPNELFFRTHRDFRTHYSVIREEIHAAKSSLFNQTEAVSG